MVPVAGLSADGAWRVWRSVKGGDDIGDLGPGFPMGCGWPGVSDLSPNVNCGSKTNIAKGDSNMKKLLRLLLLVCMVLPMASLPAYAEVPTEVSGTFTYVPVCEFPGEYLGANWFLHCTDTETWTGPLAGTVTTEYWVIFHGSGVATFSSKGQFVGSVLGSDEGTAEFQVTGILKANADEWQGTWWMGQGSEGLEGVHGEGTWDGLGVFEYEGLVHFDP